jgi:hypothetical protein
MLGRYASRKTRKQRCCKMSVGQNRDGKCRGDKELTILPKVRLSDRVLCVHQEQSNKQEIVATLMGGMTLLEGGPSLSHRHGRWRQ